MKRRKSQTKCIAFCGIFSALAVVIMLITFIPYLMFVAPVIASCVIAFIYIELDYRYSILSYFTIALLSLLFSPDKEAAMMFVGVFGLYPIIKILCENKIKITPVQYIFKLLYLNIGLVISYLIIIFIFGIPLEGTEDFGKFAIPVLLVLANIMFIMNDAALARIFIIYNKKFKGKFFKL